MRRGPHGELFDQPLQEALNHLAGAVEEGLEAGKRVSGAIRFALKVPDLQAALDRLVAHGATIVHPPIVTPWGHHNVRLQDPDGLQITLFQVLDEG